MNFAGTFHLKSNKSQTAFLLKKNLSFLYPSFSNWLFEFVNNFLHQEEFSFKDKSILGSHKTTLPYESTYFV